VTDPNDRRRDIDAWLALVQPEADFPGTVDLPMLTGSMAPLIPVGSRLEIVAARRRSFGVGDIVVFERATRLVAHRLVFSLGFGRDTLYLEKGDRNVGLGLVRKHEVRGVVTGWRPGGEPEAAAVPLPRSRRAALRSLGRSLRIWLGRLLRLEATDRPRPPDRDRPET
jgi:hypothetical protein